MATSTAGVAFQANFKSPNGTLLNIYAENGQEFGDLLDAFPDFLGKIAAIESTIRGASEVAAVVPLAPPQQQPPAYVPQGGYPQAATAAPGGEHLCEHGKPMKFIQAGISKATGKPYKAFYACNEPRGQQCNAKVAL
jgi:hypothetical protein